MMERRAALHGLLSGSFAWLTGRRLAPANNDVGIAQRQPPRPRTSSSQTYDVRDFGARGDGVTDDSAAIQAACNAAVAGNDTGADVDHPADQYGGSAMVIAVGTFVTSRTITIATHFDGSRATFLVKGSPTVGVRVAAAGTAIVGRKLIRLPEVINTVYIAPPDTKGIGVQVVNAQFCELHLRKIEAWNTAIDVVGDNDGTAWSRFYLGWMINNTIGLQLTVGTNGWVNENQFHGGSFSTFYAPHTPGTRYIKVGRCNNNTFYSNALEGDPEFHIECWGRFNLWFMPRLETRAGPPKAVFMSIGTPGTSGCDNALFLGYPSSSGPIVVTNSGVGAGRNNVIAWEPGPQGGLTFHGPQIFDRVASDNATMFVDDETHRLGLGKMAPTERVDLRYNSNIAFDAFAFLGQLFSTAGLVLGVNAKADTAGGVGNQVIVAQNDNNGYQFIRLGPFAGISFHAARGAVIAGAVADAEQMRLTPAGNLGLGTRTPAAKLAVNGGVHIGGDADPGDKNLLVEGSIKAPALPAFNAGDRYLVVDAAGNIHVSAVGPAT
jgi:hypothetical protein